MATIKYEAGSIQTLASTELNSLASGSGALGAEYDNGTNLYLWGLFELAVDFVSAPAAGGLVDIYLIPAPDGTNYVDNTTGASEYAPTTTYASAFPIQATANAQRVSLGLGGPVKVELPPTKFKVFVINNTNQAFPASGSTIKMVPTRLQSS